MLKLYNTLTRKKEEFKPLEEGRVGMYVCGPTVYDVPHIGHARSAYVFEVIRRYFEYKGFDVFFVKNVTDVDDKIINRAAEELREAGEVLSDSRLKQRAAEVASRYLDVYHREMEILGIRPPVVEPRATENIEKMVRFIEVLIDRGYAYAAGGNVYFDVERSPEYGKLSGQDKDQMIHGVRVDIDGKKRQPLDFALWKKAGGGEPSWGSPWGDGRPGWHIECSVMSTDILGPRFDIHGGGLDLIFPHHENEIAQAEAATGGLFANYWVHNGLLTVNGEKMSKSLRNYVTISDFLKEHRDPDLLKIAFVNSHYRSPVDYSDGKIEEAGRSRQRIMIFMEKTERLFPKAGDREPVTGSRTVQRIREMTGGLEERFTRAMDDDFNTPVALSAIFEAVRLGNECLAGEGPDAGNVSMAAALRRLVRGFAEVLGLSLEPVSMEKEEAARIERLVAERENARERGRYDAADEIRRKLVEKGIVIEDTPEGTVWRKS